MAFTVNVHFLGIFGIVPDQQVPTKLAFLLPATDYPYKPHQCDVEVTCNSGYGLAPLPRTTRLALDEKPLERHRWFVEYDPSQLVGVSNPPPSGNRAQWTVSLPHEFRRMTFKAPGASLLSVGTGLDYVAKIPEVAKRFGSVKPEYLGWPAATDIGGQVMFELGELVPPIDKEMSNWAFPATLRLPDSSTSQYVVSLAHRVHLRLNPVASFSIETRATQAGPILDSLTLQPTASLPEVDLTICNLCNYNPLRWPPHPGLRVDDDFRWLYELCDNKTQITDELKGLDLPVPHPHGSPGALGQNCLEGQFAPTPFVID